MPVVLEKGSKINLSKGSKVIGNINVNLNWNSKPVKKGFRAIFLGNGAIDLDLGCLYEMKDGSKGAIQALGNSFGSLNRPPYIMLDGDDRSGNNSNGENIFINGEKIKDIKRILVYTFIYEGITNWKQADGKVRIHIDGEEDVIINMDEYDDSYPMCALMMLDNNNGTSFSAEKLVRFFKGHREMDRAYNWGLRWVEGRK